MKVPMTTYELTVGEFKGPLEKLLELIEAEKMDVSEVSMARVTDDFLKYLDALKTSGLAEHAAEEMALDKIRLDLRVLADFISVASRLIFLKSKYLLPGLSLTDEEEADIKDLEERLKRYQDLKPALRYLNQLWGRAAYFVQPPVFPGTRKRSCAWAKSFLSRPQYFNRSAHGGDAPDFRFNGD